MRKLSPEMETVIKPRVDGREINPLGSLLVNYRRLYGSHLDKTRWFVDASQDSTDPSRNINFRQASDWMLPKVFEHEGVVILVTGCMTSGKSQLAENLFLTDPNRVVVHQHVLDKMRSGGDFLFCQDNGGRLTEVPTRNYQNGEDLLHPETGLVFERGVNNWLDELNMAGNKIGSNGNPYIGRGVLKEIVKRTRLSGANLIISMLDFHSGGKPFANTPLVLEYADHVLVMAARCGTKGCANPALFTSRFVKDEFTNMTRPDTPESDIVHVGRSGDEYLPACINCHTLWSPERLNLYRNVYITFNYQLGSIRDVFDSDWI